jgi:hypothetical protein
MSVLRLQEDNDHVKEKTYPLYFHDDKNSMNMTRAKRNQ